MILLALRLGLRDPPIRAPEGWAVEKGPSIMPAWTASFRPASCGT